MSREFNYYDLGWPGRSWVQICLLRGFDVSRRLESLMNINAGTVIVMGPNSIEEIASVPSMEWDVSDSALSMEPSAEALVKLLEKLQAHYGPCTIVVEDWMRKSTDPAIMRLPSHARPMILRGTLYHWREVVELFSANDLMDFLYFGGSYPLNSYVFRDFNRQQFQSAVENEHLREVADHTIAVINEVFDGRGFSCWLRSDVSTLLAIKGFDLSMEEPKQ